MKITWGTSAQKKRNKWLAELEDKAKLYSGKSWLELTKEERDNETKYQMNKPERPYVFGRDMYEFIRMMDKEVNIRVIRVKKDEHR